jgi:hypothetical protein
VPFLIRGLALPVSPFFRGLLDFYSLNITLLNPNYVLQIAMFVHLCEAFLGILPHLSAWDGWRAASACCLSSLELHRSKKAEYLDIPLKDSIKGWCFEWFTMENHNKSLPARSGRQPNV